jgi:hypothetical protein
MLEGGGKAESFMKNQGYDKLPTQYIEYSNTRTDKFPFGPNRSISVTTGDKIHINEKYGYIREGAVGVPYNIESRLGKPNPLISTERVDRKCVNHFNNKLIKIANSIYNIYSPLSGDHDYTNKKIYNSWGEYPKNNSLINKFKN